MFTLWYSILSWKEYREVILDKLSKKGGGTAGKEVVVNKKTDPVSPLPQPPKQLAVITPPKPIPPAPVPTVTKPIPTPPPKVQPAPAPKLDPPAKPPRSPSPHPMRTEVFDDDIEYEEEESEEDEENSVIDSTPSPSIRKPAASTNDFINVERKNQQTNSNAVQRKGQGQ